MINFRKIVPILLNKIQNPLVLSSSKDASAHMVRQAHHERFYFHALFSRTGINRALFSLTLFASALHATLQFSDFDIYQGTTSHQEIENKINTYLLRDQTMADFYTITDDKLTMFTTPNKTTVEFVLEFGTKSKPVTNAFTPNLHSTQPLAGLRITLDPGHLGGSMARIEERFIDMELIHRNNRRVQFDEGTLATATAKMLRSYLVQLGAQVLLTREEPGQPVYRLSFSEWCTQELAITQDNDWSNPDIQQKIFDYLNQHACSKGDLQRRLSEIKDAPANISDLIKQALFRLCYNMYDLRACAEKINAFNPHLTLIIHYNATEAGDATSANYLLTFIPGNFLKGELATQQTHYEFLRLLLTDDLERSLTLSCNVAHALENMLNVPLMKKEQYQPVLSRFITDGVYCRNLALTRLIHNPLCYGETLIQNNPEVAEQLADTSVRFEDFYTSPLVVKVAQGYFLGICNYFGIKNVPRF